MGGNIGFAHR